MDEPAISLMTTITPDLIERAREGDSVAIAVFYEQYRDPIYRFLYYRLGDPQVAEDLTSEVFLRMINSLSDYHPQNVSFQAWLYQIARNLSIDHYRKASIRNHTFLEENLVTGDNSAGGPVERKLTSITLRQALTQINEDQRDVLVMRFVAGMPIADVAQSLRRSENAIKALQRRGLIALRKIFTEWEVSYA